MNRTMSKKTVRYTEGEIGKVKVVKDFLPPPDQLVLREENVKAKNGSAPLRKQTRITRRELP